MNECFVFIRVVHIYLCGYQETSQVSWAGLVWCEEIVILLQRGSVRAPAQDQQIFYGQLRLCREAREGHQDVCATASHLTALELWLQWLQSQGSEHPAPPLAQALSGR